MNARTVNISSLVILLALLSLICEGFLYYFLPSPIWSIVFAVLVSLALSHFFLESSFSYSYNVLHAAFMTIGAFIYAVIVYCIQPNPWLHYSFYLVLLVLVNWLTPFLYCSIRDLYDTTPHFEGYRRFFIQMSIVLLVCYILALIKQYYIHRSFRLTKSLPLAHRTLYRLWQPVIIWNPHYEMVLFCFRLFVI